MTLTHFKNKNQTIEMVDISKKKRTARIAVAESLIKIDKNLYQVLLNDQNLFSNLCATAKIAGVLAAKNTSLQIPLTHQVPIDHITIEFKLFEKEFLRIKKCAQLAKKLGIEVHAGHGLDYKVTKLLCKIKEIREFNIGHFFINLKTSI